MKRLFFAIGALILALIICFSGYFVLSSSCGRLIESLEKVSQSAAAENAEEALERTEEALKLWEKLNPRINALTHHEETDELEEIVKSLTIFAEQKDLKQLYEKSETAINRLEHIEENEKPVFGNIF